MINAKNQKQDESQRRSLQEYIFCLEEAKEEAEDLAIKGTIFNGTAGKIGGSYVMDQSDQIRIHFGNDIQKIKDIQKKFKWVEKYINIDVLNDWIRLYTEFLDMRSKE